MSHATSTQPRQQPKKVTSSGAQQTTPTSTTTTSQLQCDLSHCRPLPQLLPLEAETDKGSRLLKLEEMHDLSQFDGLSPETRDALVRRNEHCLELYLKQRSKMHCGYQCNQSEHFSDRLAWSLDMHLNTIGDSFVESNLKVSTKPAERACGNFFSKIWVGEKTSENELQPSKLHFDDESTHEDDPDLANQMWAYTLSMGSTEANLCAVRLGRDYLKGKFSSVLYEHTSEFTQEYSKKMEPSHSRHSTQHHHRLNYRDPVTTLYRHAGDMKPDGAVTQDLHGNPEVSMTNAQSISLLDECDLKMLRDDHNIQDIGDLELCQDDEMIPIDEQHQPIQFPTWPFDKSVCLDKNLSEMYPEHIPIPSEHRYTHGTHHTSSETQHKGVPVGNTLHYNTHYRHPILLCSDETHYSITKIRDVLEIYCPSTFMHEYFPCAKPSQISAELGAFYGDEWPTRLPSYEDGTCNIDALMACVKFFLAMGNPLILVLTNGTTFTSAYDDIDIIYSKIRNTPGYHNEKRYYSTSPDGRRVLRIAQRTNVWIHSDGALGGYYSWCCQRNRLALDEKGEQSNFDLQYKQEYDTFLRKWQNSSPFIQQQTSRLTAISNDTTLSQTVRESILRDCHPSKMFLPDFNFRRNCGVKSASVSGHKFAGSPTLGGLMMCPRRMLLQFDTISYLGSSDTTIAGSRNGLNPLLMHDFLARNGREGIILKYYALACTARYCCYLIAEAMGCDILTIPRDKPLCYMNHGAMIKRDNIQTLLDAHCKTQKQSSSNGKAKLICNFEGALSILFPAPSDAIIDYFSLSPDFFDLNKKWFDSSKVDPLVAELTKRPDCKLAVQMTEAKPQLHHHHKTHLERNETIKKLITTRSHDDHLLSALKTHHDSHRHDSTIEHALQHKLHHQHLPQEDFDEMKQEEHKVSEDLRQPVPMPLSAEVLRVNNCLPSAQTRFFQTPQKIDPSLISPSTLDVVSTREEFYRVQYVHCFAMDDLTIELTLHLVDRLKKDEKLRAVINALNHPKE